MARRTYQRRAPRAASGIKRERGGFWPAATTDRPGNPQRCGLSGLPLVGTDTVAEAQASVCYFLTCKGTDPLPVAQIEVSRKDPTTGEYSTDYRSAPTGETVETEGADGRKWHRKVFGFQERTSDGWRWVACWDKVVLVSEAAERGFRVPEGAAMHHFKGDRTLGTKHQAGAELTPMAVLASVLDDEVSPMPTPVDETPAPAPAPAPAPEAGAERFRGLELD